MGASVHLSSREQAVPWIEVSDEQILKSLDSLSPQGRRQAVLRLIAGADVLDRTIEKLRPRLIELAEERGLNWARFSEEERERLVDEILHG
jgi:hypothetical protein